MVRLMLAKGTRMNQHNTRQQPAHGAQQPSTHYNNSPMPPVSPAKSGMAIAGFVLGIIALLTSFVPIVNNLSFFLALLGIILTIIGFVGIAKGKKSGKAFAIAALIICVISCAVVLASQSAYSAALNSASSATTVSSATDSGAGSSTSSADAAKADFTISDETLNKDSYSATITGTITNTTSQDKSYVGVTYNLYDKDGNLIGNASDGVNGLKAGASWKFEAYAGVSDPKQVATFDRVDITSW